MAQWGTTSESGILRKNKPKDNHDDLLVFGYACKLFRDDEKASYIDKGHHLIPWMGDESLKIDRYDCRGALSDLSPYEASREGFDAMRWLGLSESERKLEQLCDKERYYSLHINEEEEEMYKEEEQKRQKTNEFQYSYDVPTDPAQEMAPTVPEAEQEDEEYVPLPHLDVPVDIAIPKTVKENIRIEKTALFVCKQGPQMEILIKAKQSNNPQFGFLNQGHNLYKYYRHVLAAIKGGRYQVTSTTTTKKEEKCEETTEPTSTDDHYLHPSLLSTATQLDVHTSSIPTIPYKPSANCSYSQLVNRIQGSSQTETTAAQQAEQPKPPEAFSQMTYEQQQYYQYYYAAQYYEYYKQLAQYQQGNGQGPNVQPPETHLDPAVQNYIQQMAYAQYMQHQSSNSNNSYAQIVSNVNSKEISNPYPVLPENQPIVTNEEVKIQVPKKETEESDKEPAIKNTLLSLAVYGSDSESEQDEEIKVPTGEIQIVIDKMATYVAKNGVQFEEIVKAKGDPRFEFLNESHEFYKYYKNKVGSMSEVEKKDVKPEPPPPPKPKEKKVIAPVCFSIKKPKDDGPKEIKSALPVEESDDEDTNISETSVTTTATPTSETVTTVTKESGSSNDVPESSHSKNGAIFDGDDPLLEMIDLTDDLEEKKDAKRAEDKIKDKLAAAAREKMVSVARDRALQLERKKKAAAFLKLKSAETTVSEETKPDVPPTTDESSRKRSRSRSRTKDNRKDVVQIDDSADEDEDRKKRASRKKKSHKRKHSKSKHDSRSKKKSKKKRRRSESCSSTNSKSS